LNIGNIVEVINGNNGGRIGKILNRYAEDDARDPHITIELKDHWIVLLDNGRKILEPEANLKLFE